MCRRSYDGASAVGELLEGQPFGQSVRRKLQPLAAGVDECGQLRPVGRADHCRRQVDKRLRRARRRRVDKFVWCWNMLDRGDVGT